MLGYLILIVLQAAAAWFLAPEVLRFIPPAIASGDINILVHAAIFAVIVWVTGVVGSLVLQDVKMPASSTLVAALAGALIGAVIVIFPQVRDLIPLKFHPMFLPLAGAIIGYLVRR